MAKHDPLWISSGATGVDEHSTMPWSLFLDNLIDFRLWNLLSNFQEVIKWVKPYVFEVLVWQFGNTPADEGTNWWQLINDRSVQLKLLNCVNHDYLSLRMLSLVLAGIGTIGGVDTTDRVAVQDWSKEWYGPLRAVESHNVYDFAVLDANLLQTLCKRDWLLIEFSPCPSIFFVVPHDFQCRVVSSQLDSLPKYWRNSVWLQLFTQSWWPYFYWELLLQIGRPVHVLSIWSDLKFLKSLQCHFNSRVMVDVTVILSWQSGWLQVLRNFVAKIPCQILVPQVRKSRFNRHFLN